MSISLLIVGGKFVIARYWGMDPMGPELGMVKVEDHLCFLCSTSKRRVGSGASLFYTLVCLYFSDIVQFHFWKWSMVVFVNGFLFDECRF